MMFVRVRSSALATVLAVAASSLALAQAPTAAPGSDSIEFQTKLGSFKFLGANEQKAKGHLVVSFNGTIMLSRAVGKLSTSGALVKEYEDSKHQRLVYHGSGKLDFEGEYEAIQWFGDSLKGTFKGVTAMRLYGEFAADYSTGTYKYGFAGAKESPWMTGGITISVPAPAAYVPVQQKVEVVKGK